MKTRNFHLHDSHQGAALALRISPMSDKDKITELLADGTIKIQLASTNIDESNDLLVKFLADILGVSASKIDIIGGKIGNDKLITILDIDKEEAQKRLLAHLE